MLEESVTLNTGAKMPVLGFGTWQIKEEDAEEAVSNALSLRYRHIDTAVAYHNEKAVGEAIRKSGIAREDIFLTSKVPAEAKSYKKAKEEIEGSLKRLGVDYLDLMLIHCPKPWALYLGHFPKSYDKENLEVWKALSEAKEAGKIRAIGVSNFSIKDLKNILEHSLIVPAVNQIPVHVGHVDQELIAFCKEQGIAVEAYSPIATGRLLKKKALAEMAGRYGVSVAQLCIRFCYQLGTVPLPKASHKEHMEQNTQIDFAISKGDMAALLAM